VACYTLSVAAWKLWGLLMQRDSGFHPPLTKSSNFGSVKLPLRKGSSQETGGSPALHLAPFSGSKSPGLPNPSALTPLFAN